MTTRWMIRTAESAPIRWRAVIALCIASHLWCGGPGSLAPSLHCAAAATSMVHDAPLDEAVDFYQFTDSEGGVHFVDSPDKIPGRYRSRAIVRKDMPAARQTTRIAVNGNSIHVPVLIRNGERTAQAVMLLDTGASMTSITGELASRLGIDLAAARKSTSRLADGSMIDIRLVQVDAVAIGFRRKSPLEVSVIQRVGDRELHDGLLGIDFLGDFQYQIDLPNRMIRWQ